MTAVALLRELDARGIRVVVQGDKVSLRGPGDVLTAELTEHLRQHKPEILEAARRCPTCGECGAVIGSSEPRLGGAWTACTSAAARPLGNASGRASLCRSALWQALVNPPRRGRTRAANSLGDANAL